MNKLTTKQNKGSLKAGEQSDGGWGGWSEGGLDKKKKKESTHGHGQQGDNYRGRGMGEGRRGHREDKW